MSDDEVTGIERELQKDLVFKLYPGKENQKIAQELGISVTAVKSQKQRSLQLLRLWVNPEIFGAILCLFLLEQ